MLTLNRLLRAYGAPVNGVRLVRHTDGEIEVLNSFRENRERFEAYQAFQRRRAFDNATHIISFCGTHGRTALLLGMWTIDGQTQAGQLSPEQLELIDHHQFPAVWRDQNTFYRLRRDPTLDDLSQRLIIDWGLGARAFIQPAGDANDKPVLEIRQREAMGAFTAYADVRLTFDELRRMMANPDANPGWRLALSAVRGIYLIRETTTGLLYVGAAYGARGIFGRWNDYADTGDGGDVMLRGRDPRNFEFSILEVISPATPAAAVIDIESQWKTRLGTRKNGHLNSAEATGQ